MKGDCTDRLLDLGNQRYNRESPLSPNWIIQNVKPSDAGQYRCIATDENKTVASEYISVEVLCKYCVIKDLKDPLYKLFFKYLIDI